jgi:hypothetical protein
MAEPLSLLRDIVWPFEPQSVDARCALAVTLLGGDEQLPESVRNALVAFAQEAGAERLRDVQEAVARESLHNIGTDAFVPLTALLAMDGRLDMKTAAMILAEVPYDRREHLSRSFNRLLDVAGAVVEDVRDGVMDVDDDALFANALQAAIASR